MMDTVVLRVHERTALCFTGCMLPFEVLEHCLSVDCKWCDMAATKNI